MNKDEVVKILNESVLFAKISTDRIAYLLSLCKYNIEDFEKDNVISNEGDFCSRIGFILDGKINAIKLNPNGNHMTVRSMTRGDYFGDALVFSSKQECPTNIVTTSSSSILFISYESLLYICEIDEMFLKNFLRSLSDKIFLLNEKIKILSYQSVRQKLSYFLVKLSDIQQSKNVVLNITREELSDFLGVTRPSISRELSKMAKNNLIKVYGKNISILDIEAMRKLL